VIARSSDGEQKRLLAYVVPDMPLTSAVQNRLAIEVRGQLRQRLPAYMVPAALAVIEALPLNANGKVDRNALPPPTVTAFESGASAAPQRETERALAQLWQELLHVEQVGRYDNFFELGGDSLSAMKLMVELANTFSVQLSIDELPRFESLLQLAQFVDVHRGIALGRRAAPAAGFEDLSL
jgi:acyl carrier protein